MWVFLLILAIPLIEIGLFVQLGGAIGLWATLAWVLISAGIGVFILRRIGMQGAVTLRRDMADMRDPLSPLAHRAMLVLAAVLLLLPGFLTDAMGLLLLLKPVRSGLIALVARRVRVVTPRGPSRTTETEVIEGDWSEIVQKDDTPQKDKPSGWTQH
jgi:UPF0716 protein FxsA